MSKKSGFFYAMIAIVAGFFYAMIAIVAGLFSFLTKYKGGPGMYQPTAPIGGGGSNISSYGQKPYYGHLKRKPFYQQLRDARRKRHEAKVWELKQEGIIWTPVGLFREKAV
jgi:hypothetical protein